MIKINKELKQLSRSELVDIIYQLKKNEQELQDEISALQNEIQDKRIKISTAGSIAEASIAITNVFSAAQMTADIYLKEVAYIKENTEKECARMLEDANKKVSDILADGQEKYADLKARYQTEYEKLQQIKSELNLMERLKKEEFSEETKND